MSYAEWLKYKQIETPSAESYERFLYDSQEFYELYSIQRYLKGCLDERIRTSFIGKYRSFKSRSWQELEQAFVFLNNCGLITLTPVVKSLENIPDIGRDLRIIAHGGSSGTDFKDGLFKNFNMCIKYPAFYVAILRDILKEQMPEHLPNGLLRSIAECHIRGLLPERLAAEYHDIDDNEIDYVNTVDKTAVEITVSNKPIDKLHFDLLPEDYRKILLTKDKDDYIQGVRRIPYYEFLASGADYNAYSANYVRTKESVVQSTKHAFEQREEACANDSLWGRERPSRNGGE